ncbi:MAG: hypothetical protein IJE55_01085, partial [Clostridia bacterium]|nr:hypothetical protein [Clostridia bacterium]MBQ6868012.1 hypothetical protein [Clostridia bacterium]MBQ7093221.1 hypothetical protein [Clostridia bacterium]
MKKYRVYIIFTLILLLLVLFREPIGNMINYKSGELDKIVIMSPGGFERIVLSSPAGERELDQIEHQQFVRMLTSLNVKTNLWNRKFEFPEEEYLIYSQFSSGDPIFRIKMTDEAIEIWEREVHSADNRQIFLIDN